MRKVLFLYPMDCYRVSICSPHRPSSGVQNRGEPKSLTRRESNPRPKVYASYAHPPPAVGISYPCPLQIPTSEDWTSLRHFPIMSFIVDPPAHGVWKKKAFALPQGGAGKPWLLLLAGVAIPPVGQQGGVSQGGRTMRFRKRR